MKKIVVLLAGAMLMTATGAMATPINSNRDFTPIDSSETTLQAVLDANFDGAINAVTDQSTQAVWKTTDGSPAAYAVAFLKGDAGNFGIYSYATGMEVTLLTNPAGAAATTFNINKAGNLVDGNNALLAANFGHSFGFFWRDTVVANVSYTEDSRNAASTGWGVDANIRALTYLVKDGTELTGALGDNFSGSVARGNDDWVMAFEDRAAGDGGDGDFQDAVFYVKDIAPVPEPGTMMLLGAGFLGLAIYGKRRKNA